jgi:integrase
MVEHHKWSRKYTNDSVDRIRRAFRWAVSREMIPSHVYEALRSVDGLRRGRSSARESDPVKPVADEHVEAVKPFVSREVWSLIQIQLFTGCRPGEATIMRGSDIDMSGRVWTFTPMMHKTQHHGKGRVIFLGPKAQAVVRRFLKTDLNAFLFSPSEAESNRNASRRQKRRTPMTPSHQRRATQARQRRRRRPPRDHYDVASYRRAITRACDLADAAAKQNRELPEDGERLVPRWSPHQLRHNAATKLRKEFGIEAARVILGHSSASTTELYAELDEARALKVVQKIG